MALGKTIGRVAALMMFLIGSSSALAADDGIWSVSKSSGEVWVTTAGGATPASLTEDANLKAGDTIRTGRNGRVLLVRGEESILMSPNSVVGLPTEKKDGLSTTILQQAGSILLEVEKRNVKHFEVETPYLAAVVKGTQFSVTVGSDSTKVGVLRGQVEVADFKTGQIAHVMPGQAATAFEHGKPGLSLSGAGTFAPIEQGKPRASTIDRVLVPKSGLPAPKSTGDGKSIRALAPTGSGKFANSVPGGSGKISVSVAPNVIRITQPIGEVHLNISKVTHGLSHGDAAPGSVRNGSREVSGTVWNGGSLTTTNSNVGSNPSSNSYGATVLPTSNNASGAAGVRGGRDLAGGSGNGNAGGSTGGGSSGKSGSNGGGSGNGNSSSAGNGNGNGNSGTGANNGNGNGGNGNGNNGNNTSGNSGNNGNGNSGNGGSNSGKGNGGNGNNGNGNGNNGGGNVGSNGNGNGNGGNSNNGSGNSGGGNGNGGGNNGNGNGGGNNGNGGNGNAGNGGGNGNGRH